MARTAKNRYENPPLIDRETFQETLGVKGFKGRLLTRILFGILGMEKANRVHALRPRPEGPAFSEGILHDLGVTYEVPENQLANIPAEGGFFTVSNHHFGSLDGMILNAVFGSRRSDYKILTTYFLSLIKGLRNWFIPVDNFSSGGARSISGIRQALDHIGSGGALGLFPAGEVATWQKGKDRTAVSGKRVVEDKPWADNMMRLIKRSCLPVIPVYFDGENSRLFHVLGRIHPMLRTVRLVREMVNKQGTTVQVRIGQPIPADQIASMDTETLGRYLRSRCYALEAQCRDAVAAKANTSSVEPVAPALDPDVIRSEVSTLGDRLLFETGDYRAYLLDAADAPALMQELYRLREVTFRSVGEGTGKALDTDGFDAYYRHLILWNIPNGEIVGAYRVGYGPDILDRMGREGFYTSTLVRFGDDADGILSHSLELGRSFITEKYQKEVLPLKLLLAGLCVATTKDPRIDRCIGLVTLSAAIPDFYKSLTIHFLKRDFSLENAEGFSTPMHPFHPDYLRVNPDDLLRVPEKDIDQFDRLLGVLSDGKYRLPVLFRKYFSCGARVSSVTVDPDFSNCVDAMIVLRLKDFPSCSIKSFIRSLPEEVQDTVLLHFFGSTNV